MALHTSGDKGDESAQVKSDFLKYLSELSGPSSSNLYLQIVRTATFTPPHHSLVLNLLLL